MRKFLSLCALLSMMTAPAVAQTPPPDVAAIPPAVAETVQQLQKSALAGDLAFATVSDLTTMVGPRMAGTEQEARARAWAERTLKGLQFDAVRIEEAKIPYWARLYDAAEIVSPVPFKLYVAALGGSGPTPKGGITAPLVRFTDLNGLRAAAPETVKGKLVFIDEPTVRTQDGSGYGVGVAKRGLCGPIAQSKGAAGCLIRSVGTHMHRFPHQGGPARARDGATLPVAAVSPPDAEHLSRLMARGEVKVRLEIDVAVKDDAPSGNVIAEVRGREKPNEIVIIGAHLDSWDQATGALDDGAGVGIVVAAAKLIQDLPRHPKRTIRVILFGAEETGLHGAIAYVKQHASETGQFIVGAESDFGARKIFRFQTRFGEAALPAARAIQRQLAPLGIGPHDNQASGGPDMRPFREAGVPVVELEQNGWDYFDYHHTPDDTLDKIDPAELRQNVAAYATFAYLAAEMDWDFRAVAK